MRYRVLDLPVQGVGAFLPTTFPNPAASSFGLVLRSGAPGTVPVPAPSPTRIWAPSASPERKYQSSNVSPDVRTPDIYIAYANNMDDAAIGPKQLAARRFTPLPIPARSWLRAARPAFRGRTISSRSSVPNPRAFQRFPAR